MSTGSGVSSGSAFSCHNRRRLVTLVSRACMRFGCSFCLSASSDSRTHLQPWPSSNFHPTRFLPFHPSFNPPPAPLPSPSTSRLHPSLPNAGIPRSLCDSRSRNNFHQNKRRTSAPDPVGDGHHIWTKPNTDAQQIQTNSSRTHTRVSRTHTQQHSTSPPSHHHT